LHTSATAMREAKKNRREAFAPRRFFESC
jgi:hypothetical protein